VDISEFLEDISEASGQKSENADFESQNFEDYLPGKLDVISEEREEYCSIVRIFLAKSKRRLK